MAIITKDGTNCLAQIDSHKYAIIPKELLGDDKFKEFIEISDKKLRDPENSVYDNISYILRNRVTSYSIQLCIFD